MHLLVTIGKGTLVQCRWNCTRSFSRQLLATPGGLGTGGQCPAERRMELVPELRYEQSLTDCINARRSGAW
jgi:hypothetical protein